MLMLEFLGIKQKAWDLVGQSDKRSPLRYGQALSQLLPAEITDQLIWGVNDFYYYENTRFHEIDMICYRLCEDWQEPEVWLSTELPKGE